MAFCRRTGAGREGGSGDPAEQPKHKGGEALKDRAEGMKKRILKWMLACLALAAAFWAGGTTARASFMSNKTEIPVNLEVSGAEALCQTEDGYVWIAQYSGLTRYDSREFVTYKSFQYNGQEYNIINVTALAARGNVLYVATSDHLYVYEDYQFRPLVTLDGVITDIVLDDKSGLLYICTRENGGIVYDLAAGTESTIPGTEGKAIRDFAPGYEKGRYYYQADEGVFDQDGNEILQNSRLMEL